MIQSELDPATAIEGARRAHARFANSRMITVSNESQHGVYATNPPYTNTRLDELVDSFLADGILPAEQSIPGIPLLPPPGS
jgi:hypothetical protein